MINPFNYLLNHQQMAAIKHYKGPCVVYAGPGSGKTTVILHRIAYLINYYHVSPENILVVTFTKTAVEEMRTRFYQSFNFPSMIKKHIQFGTFHSFFLKILRYYGQYNTEDLMKENDKYFIIKNIVKSIHIENAEDDELIRDLILDIGLYQSDLYDQESFIPKSIASKDFLKVFHFYEKYKKENHKIDFDDMLTKCYCLFEKNPEILNRVRKSFQFILIDEFQDINRIQFELIRRIADPLQNLFVVGDDDQSIYAFRGAKPEFILKFDEIYENANKIILDKNYRSQDKIVQLANTLICKNIQRIHKKICSTIEGGKDIEYYRPKDRDEENRMICDRIKNLVDFGYEYKDIAIIFRTNLFANGIIDALLDNGIPFLCRDRIYNLYKHWVARDLIDYLKASIDIENGETLEKIINKPKRYIPRRAIQQSLKCGENIIKALKANGELMPYQIRHLERLEEDLKIIRNLETRQAFHYIRKEVGYDEYVRSYCLEKQISNEGLFEILDELEEDAVKYPDLDLFIRYTEEYRIKLNEKKEYLSDFNGIDLLTMHSAKGLEYKIVFIIGAIEGITPHNKCIDSVDGIEEERRLFYVAMTRAKEQLSISSPQYRHEKRVEPSRFIKEMGIDWDERSGLKDRLLKGREIVHKIFGKGFIEQLTENIIKVRFYKSNEVKELDIETCFKNNIIK